MTRHAETAEQAHRAYQSALMYARQVQRLTAQATDPEIVLAATRGVMALTEAAEALRLLRHHNTVLRSELATRAYRGIDPTS